MHLGLSYWLSTLLFLSILVVFTLLAKRGPVKFRRSFRTGYYVVGFTWFFLTVLTWFNVLQLSR